jgi:lysophospholipase L1-like esterase
MLLKSGERFLLIGDSITDAGRFEDPEGLGFGYVRMFRELLWACDPSFDGVVINGGVSGDTIRHLERRWTRDVIDVRPDVLSISIGVNDVWRQFQTPPNPEQVFIDEFEQTYRRLLTRVKESFDCHLLLLEATIIGESPDTPHNKIMPEYNECVARLALDFDATLVPMNQAFWRAIEAHPERRLTSDDVHPLSNGHMLMALTLYKAMEGSF